MARHWRRRRPRARPTTGWRRASATHRSANLEAAEHLGQGLELLRQNPQVEDAANRRLSLLIAQGPALMATLGWSAQEVQDAYAQAAALAAATGR